MKTRSCCGLVWLLAALASECLAQTNYQRLKSFDATFGGTQPNTPLIFGANGELYGTTMSGGTSNAGTIFRINTKGGDYTVLHHFKGGPIDGGWPQGNLVISTNGMLYGITYLGGSNQAGTLFRLGTNGSNHSILKHFEYGDIGAGPQGGLLEGTDGVLYGTTTYGGGTNTGGTLFRIDKSGSNYAVLHGFDPVVMDGANQIGNLIEGVDKMLYGTSAQGGSNGFGIIFKLAKNGTGYAVLHHFETNTGVYPLAGVIQGSDGALYGTTSKRSNNDTNDFGTVFRIATNGSGFTILHKFLGYYSQDGDDPWGSLIEGSNSMLYGITRSGGIYGAGTVFRLNKDGSGYAVLKHFSYPSYITPNGTNGSSPWAALVEGMDGSLYGTTWNGGNSNNGVIFKLSPSMMIQSIKWTGSSTLLNFSGGSAGNTYQVQATTNFNQPNSWQAIGSATSSVTGTFQFLDNTASNLPIRFYRSAAP